jgi:hypothetical protein
VDTLMSMGEKVITGSGQSVIDTIFDTEYANPANKEEITGGIKEFGDGRSRTRVVVFPVRSALLRGAWDRYKEGNWSILGLRAHCWYSI